jgi:GTP-binding protein
MINYLIESEIPFVIILTKADKLKKMQRIARMEAFKEEIPCFDDIHIIPFSSQTYEGVEEVRSIIDELAEEDSQEAQSEVLEEDSKETQAES